MKEEVVVLGHLVNTQGIKPNPEKINSKIKLPAQQNVSEVKGFLEAINFYQRFIPECAKESKPLVELT